MCGITFALSADALPSELFTLACNACSSRGPDYQGATSVAVGKFHLHFFAAVLHLRGDHVAKQPFHEDDDVLIYNGEIFDGLELTIEQNDGEELFQRLRSSSSPLAVLPLLEGPYALVYYQSRTKTLFWARDPLGRRSLLECDSEGSALLLSSVAPSLDEDKHIWRETDTTGVYSLHVGDNELGPVQQHRRLYSSQASPLDPQQQLYPFDPIHPLCPTTSDLLGKDENGMPTPTSAFDVALGSLRHHLSMSVKQRVSDIPRLTGPAYPDARVAVLFSGGLDCSVLALLADELLPPDETIDLLNVAFENPRSLANAAKNTDQTARSTDIYSTPDRITGQASAARLAALCPRRQWNFVEVNVTYRESLDLRNRLIRLMRPNNSVMDLSIAQALYFAAQGTGSLQRGGESVPYQSHARVLLSGLGADEQLGGYSRHKKAFARNHGGSWSDLIEELQMDLDRLGSRNLGRDDRVISSLGKEVRYPYLAGHVIQYLAALPVHLKVDYRFGDGVGDKLLLRMLARQLGLGATAFLAKRAIQFGARSAKMEAESRNVKGHVLLS